MIFSNKQIDHMQKTMQALATIRMGDEVILCDDCWEAELYAGQTFKVMSEPRKIGGAWCVALEGIGAFDIGYLRKVS